MMISRFAAALCAIIAGTTFSSAGAQTVPSGFAVTEIVDGLDGRAVAFAMLPDGRILIANQHAGDFDLVVNGVLTESIATVPNINTWHNESGLLGIVFDPIWPDSNYLYVYASIDDGADNYTRVLRFAVSGSLSDGGSTNLVIDTATPDTLFQMIDLAGNHNGGTLRFGSDRSLYASLGDDVVRSNIQDLTEPNGKIIRISPDPGVPLASPNPDFPSSPADALDEIFAIGLRNPFRFSIDSKTDRLLIGDVGQSSYEEVDLSSGGENFGWPRYEAETLWNNSYTLIPPDSTNPVYFYAHESGPNSVVGLLSYRQADFPNDASFPPEFEGAHLFADFYHGPIYNLRPDSIGTWVADTFATGFSNPVDAAILADGSIYVLEYGNALSRISYDPGPVVTLEGGAFLEGAYLGTGIMDTTLQESGAVPLIQPYRHPMFDGTVVEFDTPIAVDEIPSGVVDWILAELRSGASPATKVATQIGFLGYDGTILGVDAQPGIHFPTVDSLSYYVVIRHRNHLPAMSGIPIDFMSGVGHWDTRTSASSAYVDTGPALADFGDGRFGLFSGDTDTDGQVVANDFNSWLMCTKAVETGYLNADLNLDFQCLADDFNLWLENTKAVQKSQVPD